MFGSNRLLIIAPIGIIAIAAIFGIGFKTAPDCNAVLQTLSAGDPPQDSTNADYSSSVTCERDCQVSFFRRNDGDQSADTENKKADSHCNTTEELDLLAQRQMAHWTLYIALLTGAGVLMLIFTLVETASATHAASIAAEASERTLAADRAWLVMSKIADEGFSGNLDGRRVKKGLQFAVKWSNCGRSPARNVRCFIDLREMPIDEDTPPAFAADFDDDARTGVVGQGIIVSTVHKATDDALTQRIFNRESKLFLYSRVEYRDIYNPDIPRWSEITVEVYYKGDAIPEQGPPYPVFNYFNVGPQNDSA